MPCDGTDLGKRLVDPTNRQLGCCPAKGGSSEAGAKCSFNVRWLCFSDHDQAPSPPAVKQLKGASETYCDGGLVLAIPVRISRQDRAHAAKKAYSDHRAARDFRRPPACSAKSSAAVRRASSSWANTSRGLPSARSQRRSSSTSKRRTPLSTLLMSLWLMPIRSQSIACVMP